MGGFALYSAIKGASKDELDFLTALRLPEQEKVSLLLNLQVLDKGNLTYMKRDMIGYLSQVFYMY